MKKFVAVLLLAGAALLAYRAVSGRPEYEAYEGFAEAWVRGDQVEALRFGEKAAVEHALEAKAIRGTPGGAAIEAYRGNGYAVESRTVSPEGDVTLEVKQTVRFDPPGATTGIGGAMVAHFHHTAVLRKTPEGWRVVSFEPTFLDVGEIRRRP